MKLIGNVELQSTRVRFNNRAETHAGQSGDKTIDGEFQERSIAPESRHRFILQLTITLARNVTFTSREITKLNRRTALAEWR